MVVRSLYQTVVNLFPDLTHRISKFIQIIYAYCSSILASLYPRPAEIQLYMLTIIHCTKMQTFMASASADQFYCHHVCCYQVGLSNSHQAEIMQNQVKGMCLPWLYLQQPVCLLDKALLCSTQVKQKPIVGITPKFLYTIEPRSRHRKHLCPCLK